MDPDAVYHAVLEADFASRVTRNKAMKRGAGIYKLASIRAKDSMVHAGLWG